MAKITQKDYEIMDFIHECITENGFPPTVREICKAVGLNSTATVHARLQKLEREGFIVHDSSKNRSMRLVNYKSEKNNNDKYLDVPMYGKVTAGIPITAIQENTETFPDKIYPLDIHILPYSSDAYAQGTVRNAMPHICLQYAKDGILYPVRRADNAVPTEDWQAKQLPQQLPSHF